MNRAQGIPGSAEREALMSQMTSAERCINRILDEAILSAQNPGKEAESFKRSLRILEGYVKDELSRRTVAQAIANTDQAHMFEAAEILRNMRNNPHELDRLRAWYVRDIQKGATR